jgi:hypothetical protein
MKSRRSIRYFRVFSSWLPSDLHIHSAAKEFKTRLFNDFANVQRFQQISVIGDDLDFVTRAAGVFLAGPQMRLIPFEVIKHKIDREPLNIERRQPGWKIDLLDCIALRGKR